MVTKAEYAKMAKFAGTSPTGLAMIMALILSIPALAQTPIAGVVAAVVGNVTVTRPATPQAGLLKLHDDVFLDDLITTNDQSRVHIMVGGVFLLAIGEHSALTLARPSQADTVELAVGEIAFQVSS